jgi:hypothetical protein
MLSACACNAQHASDPAKSVATRTRFERAVTLFFPIAVASARRKEAAQNQTPAPQCREAGADFKHAMREADDAQLMLSVAVEARRTLIGSTTTLLPTWTRL